MTACTSSSSPVFDSTSCTYTPRQQRIVDALRLLLTYKQVERLGAQVRRGEHGVLEVHFERRAHQDHGDAQAVPSDRDPQPEDPAASREEARSSVLLCRPFRVFNAAQIDGLPQFC